MIREQLVIRPRFNAEGIAVERLGPDPEGKPTAGPPPLHITYLAVHDLVILDRPGIRAAHPETGVLWLVEAVDVPAHSVFVRLFRGRFSVHLEGQLTGSWRWEPWMQRWGKLIVTTQGEVEAIREPA